MPQINVKLTEEELEYLKKFKREGQTWKNFLHASLWFMGCVIREPKTEWGEEWKLEEPSKIEKPCHSCGYCPYGQLVEAFPIKVERTEISCTLFGHDCPAFRCAEPLSE